MSIRLDDDIAIPLDCMQPRVRWISGKHDLRLGVLRAPPLPADAAVLRVIERVHRERMLRAVLVGDDASVAAIEGWASSRGVEFDVVHRDRLLRSNLDGLVSFGGPVWFHVRAHQSGVKVWEPLRAKSTALAPATRRGAGGLPVG